MLQDLGENVNEYDSVPNLMLACERHFDGCRADERSFEYFDRVATETPRDATRARVKSDYVGVPAGRREFTPLRQPEWRPRPHLRAAEIDALPNITGAAGSGVGNGINWSHVDL